MENNVRERITEIEKELKDLDIKTWELKRERDELSKELKGWFIGNRYYGNGDYWDEYLYPLGFITEEEARKWADEHNDYSPTCGDYWLGCVPAYYEVTKDEYDLYIKWQQLRRAYRFIPDRPASEYLPICDAITSKINEIVSSLSNKEIGEHSSFIHISID